MADEGLEAVRKRLDDSLRQLFVVNKLNDRTPWDPKVATERPNFEILSEIKLEGFSYTLIRNQKSGRGPLTGREKQIAVLAGSGLPNKRIAQMLGISQFTVANHLRKIFRKLNIKSRAALASQAILVG
jgi:DNA-binding CsgD family transcriptional regulator